MKLQTLPVTLLLSAMGLANAASAQLFIDNAQFFIQPGASVTVQGDVTSNADIQGTGKLILKGAANQNINMGGFTIPNLEMDNATNVTLTGNVKIGSTLLFTTGKILLGDNNLTLSEVAAVSGQGASKFIETNSNGQLVKLLTADVASVELPLGVGTNYRPAFVTATGTYSNASVGVKALAVVDPNKPPMISDYVATYWPVTKTGVTGTVTVAGQYLPADITGTEANLRGYFFNGTDWSSTGETHDAGLHRISVPITSATGNVSGMDKFVLAKAKVFLQGAYNSVTGVMSDALRTPTNLIPLTDPYRVAPYNFVQVANATTETAAAAVFADKANTNDNIVDWVFLELRNNGTNPGSNVLQTRSALVKRDGSIVDVDGTSPVTFNNVADADYTVAVRHRNHLGISADPTTNLLALKEQKSTAPLLDLTSATDPQIFGAANVNYSQTGAVNLLYSGNANFNGTVNYSSLGNDRLYLLNTILAGSTTTTLSGYSAGDLNMNRVVNYSSLGNDRLFLLNTVLGGSTVISKSQALPN